jgi:hypothetical protein
MMTREGGGEVEEGEGRNVKGRIAFVSKKIQ